MPDMQKEETTMTPDEAKVSQERYFEEHLPEVMENLAKCEECGEWLKTDKKFIEVWKAGCWLNEQLRENGATEEEVYDIGFSHGQRSVFGNTYEWALKYLNEFLGSGTVKDKPGSKLADRINAEQLLRPPTKSAANN